MAIKNNWLTPFQRSFDDIKSQLMSSLRVKTPEITDFSEGNIFIRILSIVSAIAEVLHYYIDNVSRETFFVTARKYSSIARHSKMVDYRIRSANPASVDILIFRSDNKATNVDINVPAGTIFMSSEGYPFVTSKPKTWRKDTYSLTVSAKQVEYVTDVTLGNITNEDLVIKLGDLGSGNLYSEGSMSIAITVAGVTENWTMVETFAYSKPTSKHFKVELDGEQEPTVYFGNGINGAKPPIGGNVKASYGITRGASGNTAPQTLTAIPTNISSQSPGLSCLNRNKASGGTNYEDFDMLKQHVPLHIRTLGVAINIEDYASLAKLVPGVDKAIAKEACGKAVTIYITPDNGGIASQELLDQVRTAMISKKILGTSVEVKAARESLINLSATITGKPSFKATDISRQVMTSLISKYDYNHSGIGKPVRLSELYAFLEGLSMVDYLKIDNLYLKPTPIPYSNAVELNFEINVDEVLEDISYLLRYDLPTTSFEVIRLSGLPTNVAIPYQGSDSEWVNIGLEGNTWSIRILPSDGGPYLDGNLWKITILKSGVDQITPELAIPIFSNEEQIKLDIIEVV